MRHHAQNQQRPLGRAKHRVENDEDDQNRQRHDDREPRLGPLGALIFARPLEAIAGRKLDLLIDLRHGLFDRAAQIAAAHVERHAEVAAVAFAVDVVSAVADLHFGQLCQRDALSGGGKQANVGDGLLVPAIRLLIAHDDVVSLRRPGSTCSRPSRRRRSR